MAIKTGSISNIKGATVFIDKNGDGIWNEGEVKGIADDSGVFSLNGKGAAFKGTLISTGGINMTTGLANTETFMAPKVTKVVNSLTTLVAQVAKDEGLSMGQAMSQVKDALGIKLNILSKDPAALAESGKAGSAAVTNALAALEVQKQIDTVLKLGASTLSGAAAGTDATTLKTGLLSALVEKVVSGAPLDLTSGTLIQSVLTTAAATAGLSATDIAKVTTLAADAASVITASTAKIAESIAAVTELGKGATTAALDAALTNVVNVETVAATVSGALQSGAAGGSLTSVKESYTGTALDNLVVTPPAPPTDGTIIPPPVVTPPAGGGGGGGGDTSSTPTFSVTEGTGDNAGKWTVGTQNGNVTVTTTGSGETLKYVFTPDNGTAQEVLANSVTSLVVNTITLTGTAAVLSGETITGTGTVAVTALQSKLDADLSEINATTVTAAVTTASGSPVLLLGGAQLGKAAVSVTGNGDFIVDSGDLGTATFNVGADASLNGKHADLSGKTVTGTGSVCVELAANTDVSTFADTLTIKGMVSDGSVDISSNTNLGKIDQFFVGKSYQTYTLTLTAAQASGKEINDNNAVGNVVIKGSDGAQTINVATTGTNTITPGAGADNVTLGAGTDTVIVKFGGDIPGFVEYTVDEAKLSAGDTFKFTVAGGAEQTLTVAAETTVNDLVTTINADVGLSALVTASNNGGKLKLVSVDATKDLTGTMTNKTADAAPANASATAKSDAVGGIVEYTVDEAKLSAGDTFKFTVAGGAEQTLTVAAETTVNDLVTTINADVGLSALVTASNNGGKLKLVSVDATKDLTGTMTNKTADAAPANASATAKSDAVGGIVEYTVDEAKLSAGDTFKFTVAGGAEQTLTVAAETTVNDLVTTINADVGLSALVTASNNGGKLKLVSVDATKDLTGTMTNKTADAAPVVTNDTAGNGSDVPGFAEYTVDEAKLSAGDLIKFTVTGGVEQTFTVAAETTVDALVTSINGDAGLAALVTASNNAGKLKLVSVDATKDVTGTLTDKTPDATSNGAATVKSAAVAGFAEYTVDEAKLSAGDLIKFTVTGGVEQTFTVAAETTVDALVTSINGDAGLAALVTASNNAGKLKLVSVDATKGVTGTLTDKTPDATSNGAATVKSAAVAGFAEYTVDAAKLSAGDLIKFTVTGGVEQTFTVAAETTVDALVASINGDAGLAALVTASNNAGKLKLVSVDATKGVTGTLTDKTPDATSNGAATVKSAAVAGFAEYTVDAAKLSAGDLIKFTVTGGVEQTFTVAAETTVDALVTSINGDAGLAALVTASNNAGKLKLVSVDATKGVTGTLTDKTPDATSNGAATVKSAAVAGFAEYTVDAAKLSAGDLIKFTVTGGVEQTFTVAAETTVDALVASINGDGALSALVTASNNAGKLKLVSVDATKGVTGTLTDKTPDATSNGAATVKSAAVGGFAEYTVDAAKLSAGDLIKFTVTGGVEQTFTVAAETTVDALVTSINGDAGLAALVTASNNAGKLKLVSVDATKGVTGTLTDKTPDATSNAVATAKSAGVASDANDIITGFAIGTDKIDLLTVSDGAVAQPTALIRVTDVATSDDLASALGTAFAGLTANQAGLVVISAGTAAGTYLYADNGNGNVDATADVFISLVGTTGTLGAVGALTVGNYFA